MMNPHGCWSYLKGCHNPGIFKNRDQQAPQIHLRDRLDEAAQLAKHLLRISGRSGAEVGFLELSVLASADPLHDQLGMVVVKLDHAPHFHDVVALEQRRSLLRLIPRLCLQLPGTVTQEQVQIPAARALGPELFSFTKAKNVTTPSRGSASMNQPFSAIAHLTFIVL